jgi:fumarate reductase subunit C
MTVNSTPKKSKELIRPMPAYWWLQKRTYFLFMVRELTCVFVGGYAVFLLILVGRANDAQAFSGLLHSPLSIGLHLIALPMVLYHSITWFNLTPKVMVVWRGEERVSPLLIAGSNYVAWLIISFLVAWIAFKAE